jgi:hypothetical protein
MRNFLRGVVFAAEGPTGGGQSSSGPNPAIGTSAFAQSIGSTAPPSAGASATVMPPVAAAGVNLAIFVLAMAGGSIVLLLMYLISMDLLVGADVRGAYKEVLNPSRIGSEFYTLGRLEKLSLDLSTARQNTAFQMDTEATNNASSIITILDDLPSVTVTQKEQLQDCVPLPSDASRDDKIDQCLAILETVRQAALEAASSLTNAQTASESVDEIGSQRAAFHSFWIQAAQLILLNLLLPLLTALFGYIFGTQQAQSRN